MGGREKRASDQRVSFLSSFYATPMNHSQFILLTCSPDQLINTEHRQSEWKIMGIHTRSVAKRSNQSEFHPLGETRRWSLQICPIRQGGQNVGRKKTEPQNDL